MTSIILIYLLSLFLFSICLLKLNILNVFTSSVRDFNQAISVIASDQYSDDYKERHSRQSAFKLIKAGIVCAFKFALAIFIASVPLFISDVMKWISLDEFYKFAIRIDVILISLIVMVLLFKFAAIKKHAEP